jgi:signal transduction histidine kinase
VSRHRADPSGELLARIACIADPTVHAFASSQEARASLPPTYAPYIDKFGLRGLALLPLMSREHLRGIVTVTREGASAPFDDDDLITIKTCIEYASLAVEGAMRFEAERAAELAVNAERERIAHFQQEMLGIVGHDLRAPLAAIRIGTEMLAAKGDLGAANIVKRIDSSTSRMTRMIDQLLDMTRVRLGGGIPVARQRTPLVPIIKSVMAELSMAHQGTRFELVCDADVVGLWDPDRLGQVASNLLGNAVQYGRQGAPIIVEVTRTERAATMTVHNENRGEPIRADAIATLFDPYHRGDHSERNGNGLGLGLYIVNGIVRAHGGTIDVESIPSGTTFRVVLPGSGLPVA